MVAFGLFTPIYSAFLVSKKQTVPPEIEEKLRIVDQRLTLLPDDGELLLAKAELILRTDAPYSSFSILERAFSSGIPEHRLAPTFWACYRNVTSKTAEGPEGHQTIWVMIANNAPQLSLQMAKDPGEANNRLQEREQILISDEALRKEIVESVQPRSTHRISKSSDEDSR